MAFMMFGGQAGVVHAGARSGPACGGRAGAGPGAGPGPGAERHPPRALAGSLVCWGPLVV
jgi:hypothetical protein